VAIALAHSLAACMPGPPQRIPAGIYDATVAGSRSGFDGTWTLAIEGDGGFRLALDGQAAVTGRYESEGARVTFTDESGPMMCAAGLTRGEYSWKMERSRLVLDAVADGCPGRREILDGRAHERRPAAKAE
jgi:hypothetical protein